MHKKIGLLFMSIGAALLIAALSLFIFNCMEGKNAQNAADRALYAIIEEIREQGETAPVTSPSAENDYDDMAAIKIGDDEYIGYLSIPALELKLPVMSQWDYEKLKTAPCRYFGSTASDDLVICGHNFTEHFGLLKNLQAGDQVLFTDINGLTTAYKVEKTEILKPTQIEEMIKSSYDLTLYTCTYTGQARVTVRCSRMGTAILGDQAS